MTDYGWLVTLVGIIVSGIASWRKIKQVEHTFNSKMDQMIATAIAKALLEGHAKGVMYEQHRIEADRQLRRAET